MKFKDSTDLHVHVSPDMLPRKYNAYQLARKINGKIRRVCLKSHSFPTVALAKEVNQIIGKDIFIGSVVLNNPVGGMNPEIVYANYQISQAPFIVWFPTINSENYLKKSEWEIRPEWGGVESRKASEVRPVKIMSNGILCKETIEVMRQIKKCNCILATGHISWEESRKVVNKAVKMGISKIIVTHPIYQLIDMPIKVQKELAIKGAFIEQCYSMNSVDGIPFDKIADQIKAIGVDRCILTSDVGQPFSPDPNIALKTFVTELMNRGIAEKDIETMLIKNPNKLSE